jgi:hypothetical protein
MKGWLHTRTVQEQDDYLKQQVFLALRHFVDGPCGLKAIEWIAEWIENEKKRSDISG